MCQGMTGLDVECFTPEVLAESLSLSLIVMSSVLDPPNKSTGHRTD